MDQLTTDTWMDSLLATLPEEKLRQPINENDTQWINIEDNVARLGSLTHDQIDIAEIQRQALNLLASESKDFRLVVHLLRTLQHGGHAPELLLAAQMLVQYVQHYWQQAWPENKTYKIRFAHQVIKRFEAAADNFSRSACETQRNAMPGELAYLAKLWRDNDCPVLADAVDELFTLYQRSMQASSATPIVTATSVQTSESAPISPTMVVHQQSTPAINVEGHDDKAWRATLLKVADVLCERQPENPLGYRLRRHAVWQGIASGPQADNDGRTVLAAFSVDLMADYQAKALSPNIELWRQVEQSLLLAPYWLDGHALSARIAAQLGYDDAAEAIKDEVNRFLQRIPSLSALLFNDYSPFLSEPTLHWLKPNTEATSVSFVAPGEEERIAREHLQEQGLESALRYLETLPQNAPRDRFLRHYLATQLMEETGMPQLAQQQYRILLATGLRTSLPDWEPALLALLEEKVAEKQ